MNLELLAQIAALLALIALVIEVRKLYHAKKLKKIEDAGMPFLDKIVPGSLCTDKGELHVWESHKIFNASTGSVVEGPLCLKCGLLQGTQSQFSPKSLENLQKQKERNKRRISITRQVLDEAWAQLSQEVDFASDIPLQPTTKKLMRKVFETGLSYGPNIEQAIERRIFEAENPTMQEPPAPGTRKLEIVKPGESS